MLREEKIPMRFAAALKDFMICLVLNLDFPYFLVQNISKKHKTPAIEIFGWYIYNRFFYSGLAISASDSLDWAALMCTSPYQMVWAWFNSKMANQAPKYISLVHFSTGYCWLLSTNVLVSRLGTHVIAHAMLKTTIFRFVALKSAYLLSEDLENLQHLSNT